MPHPANRLISETSPYLLQHAHNPVDWYPWGEEALEKAKEEDKPILVSIGYSACHWCHVMERESFENEETAKLMNDRFVNIKIDREERPDIDHIYMDAVQAMTGSGGWPLNVFLTPDGRPFYGGTYFPPVRAFNRSSWKEILVAVSNAYKEKKNEIENQANKLTEHLRNANAFGVGKQVADTALFDFSAADSIADNILKAADKTWGGFGKAPKFPQTFSIQYLLQHYHYTKNEESLQQALLSLDKMIYGGIYDQLGGGFARYSTDEKWLAPHFEKMLYDNALLLGVLAEAYQLTKNPLYSNTIHHTMDFLQRELMSGEGGFYSALDADSEGVEGKFYTWSRKEVEDILKEDAELFCDFYGVTADGNWEHTNVLWITTTLEDFAEKKGFEIEELSNKLAKCRNLLMLRRDMRLRPSLDDKILLGWNALMNIACCKTYAATGDAKYLDLAENNMKFLEKSFYNDKQRTWHHTFKNGVAKYPGFLDDYAYLISAYIHLQEVTGRSEYLQKAKGLASYVLQEFIEENTGLFYFTSSQQADVIVRKKEVYDGATPAGNSTMATNLHYLGLIFDKKEWEEHARKIVNQLGNAIIQYPTSFGNSACLLQQLIRGTNEIAVTGFGSCKLLPEILRQYFPGRIIQTADENVEDFPLLKGKTFADKPLIYVCRDYSCQKPVESVDALNFLLK